MRVICFKFQPSYSHWYWPFEKPPGSNIRRQANLPECRVIWQQKLQGRAGQLSKWGPEKHCENGENCGKCKTARMPSSLIFCLWAIEWLSRSRTRQIYTVYTGLVGLVSEESPHALHHYELTTLGTLMREDRWFGRTILFSEASVPLSQRDTKRFRTQTLLSEQVCGEPVCHVNCEQEKCRDAGWKVFPRILSVRHNLDWTKTIVANLSISHTMWNNKGQWISRCERIART